MILPDWRIHEFGQAGLISPFDPDLVNPASLDLRLGDTLLIESVQSDLVPYPLARHHADDPFLLQPGEFVLGVTMEVLQLPDHICGQLVLKSSRAREGLNHALAGWVDPGWHGALTLELTNNRQLHPQPLYPGLRIAQLVFLAMEAPPAATYAVTGRYCGDLVATASRG